MRVFPVLFLLTFIAICNQTLKAQSEPSVKIGLGNELFFYDNGQIKCLDDAHRILFRRSENILEFREYGSIMFSPGAQNSQATSKMHLTSDGYLGIGTTSPSSPLTVSAATQVISLFKNTGSSNTNIAIANNNGQLSLGIGALTPHPYAWSSTGKFFIGNDDDPTFFVDN